MLKRRKNWEQYHKQIKIPKRKLNRRFPFKPVMYCKYCSNWYSAKRTGYQEEENEEDTKKSRKTAGTRNCLFSSKEITLKTESCENFVLYHNFWCNKNEHWKDINACISSQERSSFMSIYILCKKCEQGIKIKAFKTWESQTATKIEKENQND